MARPLPPSEPLGMAELPPSRGAGKKVRREGCGRATRGACEWRPGRPEAPPRRDPRRVDAGAAASREEPPPRPRRQAGALPRAAHPGHLEGRRLAQGRPVRTRPLPAGSEGRPGGAGPGAPRPQRPSGFSSPRALGASGSAASLARGDRPHFPGPAAPRSRSRRGHACVRVGLGGAVRHLGTTTPPPRGLG